MDYKEKINELILNMVKEKASDLHLSVGIKPTLRINGDLIQISNQNILTGKDVVEILKIITTERSFNDFIIKQELDFSFLHLNEYRLRGNAYFEKGFVSIVLRLVSKAKDFEELGLPEILKEIASQKQGLFLVVAPVRQGKSTTLSALINHINKNFRKHIVCIEDPIEFVHENDKSIIDQREVGQDTADFNTALIQSFRQDIDVLLVGEMRDVKTMSTAITAAETGHLVLSTLHTNSASLTVNRIIDSFPPEQQNQIRNQLSTSLLGIFSQRLLPSTKGDSSSCIWIVIKYKCCIKHYKR